MCTSTPQGRLYGIDKIPRRNILKGYEPDPYLDAPKPPRRVRQTSGIPRYTALPEQYRQPGQCRRPSPCHEQERPGPFIPDARRQSGPGRFNNFCPYEPAMEQPRMSGIPRWAALPQQYRQPVYLPPRQRGPPQPEFPAAQPRQNASLPRSFCPASFQNPEEFSWFEDDMFAAGDGFEPDDYYCQAPYVDQQPPPPPAMRYVGEAQRVGGIPRYKSLPEQYRRPVPRARPSPCYQQGGPGRIPTPPPRPATPEYYQMEQPYRLRPTHFPQVTYPITSPWDPRPASEMCGLQDLINTDYLRLGRTSPGDPLANSSRYSAPYQDSYESWNGEQYDLDFPDYANYGHVYRSHYSQPPPKKEFTPPTSWAPQYNPGCGC